jgi:Na+/proline symporter/signal transduction histidine kinase/CheY-like chemotaxis protein
VLSLELLIIISLGYLSVLFAIAYWGDRTTYWQRSKPIIYSLGLGVYCTSWSFFGVTGQAAETGWWFTPTFAGAIAVYVFVWPLVLKVARICKEYQITSLADFVATRYGRSDKLAALISIVSIVAITPYIALQLRAITNSFDAIISGHNSQWGIADNTLFFTLLLAIFAVLFGTRRVRSSEHNPGLMLAIAFESIVKLVTALIVGLFVCCFMFDGVADLFQQAKQQNLSQQIPETPAYIYLTQAVLGALMMFCLPRQFHMCFIENNSRKELITSRWLFPLYMIGINLFALPIAYAGLLLLTEQQVTVDSFMLQLPLLAESPFMTAMSYLGGFSAASSMVIVASIVLSIMVSNDLVTPWLVKRELSLSPKQRLNPRLLILVRRITIFAVLLFAYFYHKITQDFGILANTGLMAMTLLAQFSPALLFGLVWRQANQVAAYRSIIAGGFVWLYTLLIPTLLLATNPDSSFLTQGPWQIEALKPTALLYTDMEFISHGIVFSLLTNLAVFLYYSVTQTANISEQLQTSSYVKQQHNLKAGQAPSSLTVTDIAELMSRFIEKPLVESFIQRHFDDQPIRWDQQAPAQLEEAAEQELSGIIGGSSARLIIDSAKRYQSQIVSDVVDLVDEASEVLKFNRSLLQSTIQNIDQGISVVDKELKLVAWNRRYIEMFDYPEDEIYIGRPVADIIRFNVQRGLLEGTKPQEAINKRIQYLKAGQPYRFQRVHSSGKVLEMNGNPLPGGGFVTTYTDITEFVETQRALEEINEHLESRVKQRTEDLQALNQRLQEARELAEQANEDKTRYFAAVSHDLLQPFNAASLFSSILVEKTADPAIKELSQNINNSLENAEQLLNSVLELTKLDAGVIDTTVEDFSIDELLQPLIDEFSIILREKQLLSNAARYTESGTISLLLVKRNDQEVCIEVRDTGPGIKLEDQQRIFNDFEQLDSAIANRGLGLGLAISSRIAKLLGHKLEISSIPGEGSTFTVTLPVVKLSQTAHTQTAKPQINTRDLEGITVLVIDNDQAMLNAMQLRLSEWGCEVVSCSDLATAVQKAQNLSIDLVIADYHLDNDETGLMIAEAINNAKAQLVPVIVNSADQSDTVRELVTDAGYGFISKPVKPAALKRLIKRYLK